MRRLLLLASLVAGLSVTAQEEFRHGPRIGLSLATRTAGSALLQWNGLPKLGPILGWSFDAPITSQIHVLIEPMLMSKGSWTRNATWNQNDYITVRYLELPALLKLSLNPDPGGIYLSGGLIYGYALNGRVRSVRDGQEIVDYKYSFKGSNNRSQFNMAVGLGTEGRNTLWELRIQQSITPTSVIVRAQDLVMGLHFTYRLPSKP